MEEIFKILLVDDDEVERMTIRRCLKAAGILAQISEAGDSQAARQLLDLTLASPSQTTSTFDCAFLNYRLPDGDGLTLVQAIRKAGIKIPLIVLTSEGDEQIAVELMKAGSTDYISKAKLSPESLARSLHTSIRIYRAETQAARAQEQLKESEERYRLVLKGVNDGIWDWDLTKNEVYWNDRLLEIMGLDRSEFGTAIAAFYNRLHPDDRQHFIQTLETHLYTPSAPDVGYYSGEFRLLHSNGTYRHCNCRGKAQRNSQGQPLRMVGIIGDISDRQQLETARERERQQLEQIIACDPVAMAMFDDQMRYLVYSQKWLAQYDLEGESLLNRSHYDIFSDIPDRWKALHQRALQGEVLSASEDIWERADGSKIYLRWAIHPWYNADGTVAGIVSVSDTIDELVAAREAALEASRVKSQFLANMSHEIRTPMNGVLGMAGLLLQTPLNPRQHWLTQTIEHSAQHLLSVINDILDFSKIEAGEMRLEKLDFDLDECLESVAEMAAAQAEQKKLELAILVNNAVPTTVRGDPGRLQQILLNLVSNAIKFTETGAVVLSVTVSHREGEGGDTISQEIHFAIKDTGIGISPEGQKKLFQSFSQVDGSPTRQYAGTGLGLAISKQLVEMMGGAIGVESEVGKGTQFWFTVPFDRLSPVSAKRPLGSWKVLVVSASVLIQGALRSQLNRALARSPSPALAIADEATSVGAAFAQLEAATAAGHPYDAVILDLQLPELDATAFTAALLCHASAARGTVHSQPRLVVLTSLGEHHSVEALASYGAVAYLVKPVTPLRLFDSLFSEVKGEIEQLDAQEMPLLPLKILLAEDRPMNQQVIIEQLQVLGYAAECVANGQEALEKLANQSYDLVLMDCQMPVLDGYAATQVLRSWEAEGAMPKKTVVIALTAHALPADRDKCLAAGMDDYLSKPVTLEALAATLRRWVPRSVLSYAKPDSEGISEANYNTFAQSAIASLEEPLLDQNRLQQLAKVNVTLPQRLLQSFLENARADLEAVRLALQTHDWVRVEQQAHRIKGTSANVGVPAMAQVAAQLEDQARQYQTKPPQEELPSAQSAEELLATLSSYLLKVTAFVETRTHF